jgi:flagellar basal body-associated protein FliL
MSKKTIYIIISVVLVIVLVFLFAYYLLSKNPDGSTPSVTNVFKNFFPFGGETNTNNGNTPTEVPEETPVEQPADF